VSLSPFGRLIQIRRQLRVIFSSAGTKPAQAEHPAKKSGFALNFVHTASARLRF
jgi:hypothetical protein